MQSEDSVFGEDGLPCDYVESQHPKCSVCKSPSVAKACGKCYSFFCADHLSGSPAHDKFCEKIHNHVKLAREEFEMTDESVGSGRGSGRRPPAKRRRAEQLAAEMAANGLTTETSDAMQQAFVPAALMQTFVADPELLAQGLSGWSVGMQFSEFWKLYVVPATFLLRATVGPGNAWRDRVSSVLAATNFRGRAVIPHRPNRRMLAALQRVNLAGAEIVILTDDGNWDVVLRSLFDRGLRKVSVYSTLPETPLGPPASIQGDGFDISLQDMTNAKTKFFDAFAGKIHRLALRGVYLVGDVVTSDDNEEIRALREVVVSRDVRALDLDFRKREKRFAALLCDLAQRPESWENRIDVVRQTLAGFSVESTERVREALEKLPLAAAKKLPLNVGRVLVVVKNAHGEEEIRERLPPLLGQIFGDRVEIRRRTY